MIFGHTFFSLIMASPEKDVLDFFAIRYTVKISISQEFFHKVFQQDINNEGSKDTHILNSKILISREPLR